MKNSKPMEFNLTCECPVCQAEVTDGWQGKHLGMIVDKFMCIDCGEDAE